MLFLLVAAVFVSYVANAKPLSAHSEQAFESLNSMSNRGFEGEIDSRCLECICQKESNCNPDEGCNQVDGVEKCGPYQISQTYFEACCSYLGLTNCQSDSNWRSCAQDYNCATRCVVTYTEMYADPCSRQSYPSCDAYSRVHIGGPHGCRNPNTTSYWNDIQQCYGDYNPYLYPCTTNNDCTQSKRHTCYNGDGGYGTDPNGWYCDCESEAVGCTVNADCCSNICLFGRCQDHGGGNGTICIDFLNSNVYLCADGCQCIPFESSGYCRC